jgi:hypothetical protein
MAVEIVYEIQEDENEFLVYPRLYKVFKNDGEEISKFLAEFAEAPEESVIAYIKEFKSRLSELVSAIPEAKYASVEEQAEFQKINQMALYLIRAIPTQPTDTYSENE